MRGPRMGLILMRSWLGLPVIHRPDVRGHVQRLSSRNAAWERDHERRGHPVCSHTEDLAELTVLRVSPGMCLEGWGDLRPFELRAVASKTGTLAVKDGPTDIDSRRSDRVRVGCGSSRLLHGCC